MILQGGELTCLATSSLTKVPSSSETTVEYLVTKPGEEGAQHCEPSLPPTAVTLETVEFATPQTTDSTLDADHDDDLVARYRRMEDLVGGGEPPGLAMHELEEVAELHAISADEPNTFAEASRGVTLELLRGHLKIQRWHKCG